MEIPRHWRLKAQRYRLEGARCPICGYVSFPPRPICPQCASQAVQRITAYLVKLDCPHDFEAQLRHQITESTIG